MGHPAPDKMKGTKIHNKLIYLFQGKIEENW